MKKNENRTMKEAEEFEHKECRDEQWKEFNLSLLHLAFFLSLIPKVTTCRCFILTQNKKRISTDFIHFTHFSLDTKGLEGIKWRKFNLLWLLASLRHFLWFHLHTASYSSPSVFFFFFFSNSYRVPSWYNELLSFSHIKWMLCEP